MPQETCSTLNGLYRITYTANFRRGKMPLTSPPAGPTLQSQTGFDGCETVESDSPIKRNPWCAEGLVTGRQMLIPRNEHFLFEQTWPFLPVL